MVMDYISSSWFDLSSWEYPNPSFKDPDKLNFKGLIRGEHGGVTLVMRPWQRC